MNLVPFNIQVLRRFHLVGGIGSVVEAQVCNQTESPLPGIRVSLQSRNGLLAPVTLEVGPFAPGQALVRTIEILPARAGNYVLQWKAVCGSAPQHSCWTGQQKVSVYSEETIRDITFNIDVQNSKAGAEKSNMGAIQEIGDVHIHDLIREGSIRSVNDFIAQERTDATWEPIELFQDTASTSTPYGQPCQTLHSPSPQQSNTTHPDEWARKESKVGRLFRKLFDDHS